MHFLVINNGTSYLGKIGELLKGHTFEVVNFDDNQISTLEKYDAIILSGGHKFFVDKYEDYFFREIEIVLNSNLPIFGICFGFQLIAHAFGAKIKEINSRQGEIEIKKMIEDKIFEGVENLCVYENHRRAITELPEILVPLAYSEDGFEMFKHKNKLIYASQFHPEKGSEKTCGAEVFANFLKIIKA